MAEPKASESVCRRACSSLMSETSETSETSKSAEMAR